MDGGLCLKQDSQDLQDDIPRDRSVKNESRPFTVARGPVPRDHSAKPKTVRNPSPRRFLLRPLPGEGQALALRYGARFGCNESRRFHRSAGACPPRSFRQTGNIPSPEPPGGFCYVRCMARDRPSPYVEEPVLCCLQQKLPFSP